MARRRTSKQIKDAVSKLSPKIEAGVQALVDGGSWQEWLDWQSSFHRYSFGNAQLIRAQCPQAMQVAGYRDWQKRGRQVQKGQRSIRILAPMMRRRTEEDDDGNETVRKWVVYRDVGVFDISQTEGEEQPSITPLLKGDELAELRERFLEAAKSLNLEVAELAMGAHGATDGKKKIWLNKADSANQQCKTLVHELAHVKLDQDSMSQDTVEIETESAAYVVMKVLGADTSSYTFGYVASWARGDAETAGRIVRESGSRIAKVAKELLELVEV